MSRWRAGWGWLVLMAVPPVVVVSGLVALFVWQGSKGGVRGKWQKAPVAPAVVSGWDGTNGTQGTNGAKGAKGTEGGRGAAVEAVEAGGR
jgi:hypothetical protein